MQKESIVTKRCPSLYHKASMSLFSFVGEKEKMDASEFELVIYEVAVYTVENDVLMLIKR